MQENFDRVRHAMANAAVRSGRDAGAVRLVAVSKFHPADAIRMAVACGQTAFGENYVQEALAKQAALADLPIEWHSIGHIQTNKARDVAGRFALVHGVDNLRLATGLASRLPAQAADQDVLIQVNIGHEAQKSGVDESALPEFAEALVAIPRVRVLGLMGMPPFFDEPETARPYFARLRELRDSLQARLGMALPELSMGMSGDFEAAIEEGATLVRVGTTLFGPRPVQ